MYTIFTDTGCDISPQLLKEWGVRCCDLRFTFDGEDESHTEADVSVKEFYDGMRAGKTARTSALNTAEFKEAFGTALSSGEDVLYLAFSSGLSSTYAAALAAVEELEEEFPGRKVIAVDSLAASAGHGLLVYLAVKKKNEGKSIEEVAKYCEDIRLHICHWFTVDDLVYLKRGGRVSAATALAGSILGIKPVLHVDNEGHLINILKVRGRRASIKTLADKYEELRDDSLDGTVFISHGDCRDDADALAAQLKERFGVKTELITDIGPVIGAHSGPGTLALFFLGRNR